jgi:hypothetical protein
MENAYAPDYKIIDSFFQPFGYNLVRHRLYEESPISTHALRWIKIGGGVVVLGYATHKVFIFLLHIFEDWGGVRRHRFKSQPQSSIFNMYVRLFYLWLVRTKVKITIVPIHNLFSYFLICFISTNEHSHFVVSDDPFVESHRFRRESKPFD